MFLIVYVFKCQMPDVQNHMCTRFLSSVVLLVISCTYIGKMGTLNHLLYTIYSFGLLSFVLVSLVALLKI